MNQKEYLFSNGNVYIQYTIDQNGYKQGKHIQYFINGDIEELSYYKDNNLNGEFIKYFNNNLIEEQSNYLNNMLHGEYKKYKLINNKQMLILSCNYNMGHLDGLYQTWNEFNGKPLIVANYVNNKLEGPYTEWHDNGLLYKEEIYKNNKPFTGSKIWYADGMLYSEYIGNENITYSFDKKILRKEIYDINNNLVQSIEYNSNGTINSEIKFRDDKKTIANFNYNKFINGFIVKIKTIADYDNKIFTVLTPVESYFKREIYTLNKKILIKKDYIDSNGNVIPSFLDTIKSAICGLFSKTKKVVEKAAEEVELLNDKTD